MGSGAEAGCCLQLDDTMNLWDAHNLRMHGRIGQVQAAQIATRTAN